MQLINFEPLRQLESAEQIAKTDDYLRLDSLTARKQTNRAAAMLIIVCIIGFAALSIFKVFGIIVIACGIVWLIVYGNKQSGVRAAATTAFIKANGWQAIPYTLMTAGMLPLSMRLADWQGKPTGLAISGMFASQPFWLYDYTLTKTSGQHTDYSSAEILTIELPEPFPLMILDATADGSSNSAETATQFGLTKVELEGDFPADFSFYMRPGDQADALSIVSPELMDFLKQSGRFINIEMCGKYLYLVNRVSTSISYSYTKNLMECGQLLTARLLQKSQTFELSDR